MAKMKTGKPQDKTKSAWDGFNGLEADNWTITYSPKANRATLKQGDDFKVSDVSLHALKRHAEIYHGVDPEAWKKPSKK